MKLCEHSKAIYAVAARTYVRWRRHLSRWHRALISFNNVLCFKVVQEDKVNYEAREAWQLSGYAIC